MMTRSIFPAMIAALLVVAIACGGGDDAGTPSGALPEVTDVAPGLDFLGELAAVHSQPVTATFDSAAGSFSLADGATIEVPAGAFPTATELSVAIIDLLFENYLTNPPEGRIYVLSTEDDIALGAPLVLEVPKPSDSVNVTELVDGEWLPVDVPAGPATRIEIAHFSDNKRWSSTRLQETGESNSKTSRTPLSLAGQAICEEVSRRVQDLSDMDLLRAFRAVAAARPPTGAGLRGDETFVLAMLVAGPREKPPPALDAPST